MILKRVLLIISVIIACIHLPPVYSFASGPDAGVEQEDNRVRSGMWKEISGGFDYSLRVLTFGTYQDVADSTQNPDNDFLKVPRLLADLELRPDAALNFRRLHLSVKPRMNLQWSAWDDGPRKGEDDWDDDWFINEWLARIGVTESLFLSYGRENLQWGPSYLYSPSNPFFLDNGRSNPRREVPGMDFSRLVWLPKMEWTISLIANWEEGRQEFRSGDFKKIYALKLDYAGGTGSAGLILSHKERDRDRLGLFGSWTATDALLLYGDAAFLRDSNLLYPVADSASPLGVSMRAADAESSSLKGTVLVGGSYTFLAGPVLTVEYLYNGAGYDDEQAEAFYRLRRNASDAYSGPLQGLSRRALALTADPGLRFLRQHYGVVQYRQNDIRDVLNLTFSWVHNIDENSGRLISIVDCYVGDHVQLFFNSGLNSGDRETEFGTILDGYLMLGLEYTF